MAGRPKGALGWRVVGHVSNHGIRHRCHRQCRQGQNGATPCGCPEGAWPTWLSFNSPLRRRYRSAPGGRRWPVMAEARTVRVFVAGAPLVDKCHSASLSSPPAGGPSHHRRTRAAGVGTNVPPAIPLRASACAIPIAVLSQAQPTLANTPALAHSETTTTVLPLIAAQGASATAHLKSSWPIRQAAKGKSVGLLWRVCTHQRSRRRKSDNSRTQVKNGETYGNRTRASAVKGPRPNR